MSKTTKTSENGNAMQNTLQESLEYNNRFGGRTLKADQIGNDMLDSWKKAMTELHRVAYSAYAECEDDDISSAVSELDLTDLYSAIRNVLALIGNVNGHKVYANQKLAVKIIGYAGRRGNKNAGELQLILSSLSNARNELRAYEKINVTDTEYKAARIADLQKRISDLEAEQKELLDTPDMRTKEPTMTKFATFRGEVERSFGRIIKGQKAKTLEELDAEEAERKARRAARNKKNKENKRQAEAQIDDAKIALAQSCSDPDVIGATGV